MGVLQPIVEFKTYHPNIINLIDKKNTCILYFKYYYKVYVGKNLLLIIIGKTPL